MLEELRAPGLVALLAALDPSRDLQQVAALLPGGPHGAPRTLFKLMYADFTKRHKFTGRL